MFCDHTQKKRIFFFHSLLNSIEFIWTKYARFALLRENAISRFPLFAIFVLKKRMKITSKASYQQQQQQQCLLQLIYILLTCSFSFLFFPYSILRTVIWKCYPVMQLMVSLIYNLYNVWSHFIQFSFISSHFFLVLLHLWMETIDAVVVIISKQISILFLNL